MSEEKKSELGKSPECEKLFSGLEEFADSWRNEYILPEHMLYMMTECESTREILKNCLCDIALLRSDLKSFFRNDLETFDNVKARQSIALLRVIQSAVYHAASAGKERLELSDLLIAVSAEEKSHAVYFLERQGVTRYDIVLSATELEHPESDEDDDLSYEFEDSSDESESSGKGRGASALSTYASDMTLLASQGKIERIVGRENELAAMMRTLVRKKKNNPLLVGEPGVGKTALVEGLAYLAAHGETPSQLSGMRIFGIDMSRVIAGTKFRGEFEDRLRKIIDEAASVPGAVLFFDEIHTVVGSGSAGGGSIDGANLLKGALLSGAFKCIGATTYEEYRTRMNDDKAFLRRFRKIDVPEPSPSESRAILAGVAPSYARHYGVEFTSAALEKICATAEKYMRDRFMPDKAIDLLDETGAMNALLPSGSVKLITEKEVERTASSMLSIPEERVSSDDSSVFRDLEKNLKNSVISQDDAVSQLVSAVKTAKAIGSGEKPVGSFLFAGPTGVGKTELAKRLAAELGIDLIRFDMSEYSEEYSVSKLVGSAPGYIGYEAGGMLTEQVLRKPHAVLLLDEIEKAHPKIFDMLLQVMDYGTMTDNTGRKADFRNIILIMSSNAGAASLDARSISFAGTDDSKNRSDEALCRVFSPEFRNRLTSIVHFGRLDRAAVRCIAAKFVRELAAVLAAKSIELEATDEALDYFAEHGYDPKLGARPLERLVRRETADRLADEILFGKLLNGGHVVVGVGEKGITLSITSKRRKRISK